MSTLLLSLLLSLTAQEPAKPVEAPAASQAPPLTDFPLEVYYRDGLRFKTKDGNFEARIGGRMLTHYRMVLDRPDDSTLADGLRTVPDSFFIRQARLELEGTVLKEFAFKVQTDFGTGVYNQSAGTGPSSTSGTLRDAFVEWRKYPEFTVRIGQFFEPLSQEDMSSTRFIDFAERSVINRLMPGREIGLQFAGVLFEKRLDYALMLCNGTGLLNDQSRAIADTNDEKEVAALLRLTPFAGTDTLFKNLRIGIGASLGEVDNIPASAFDLISTELSVMYLNSTAGTFDGTRTRITPQLSWAAGPFALRGEYLYRKDELISGSVDSAVISKGWYGAATWIVTGEDKKVEDRIVPLSQWGAVELGLRYAVLKIDDESLLAPGVDGNAEGVRSWTAGVNWWVTRNVRFTGDVIWEKYSDELTFDNGKDANLVGFLFRAQVDF